MERLLFECAVRSTLIAAAAAAVLTIARMKNVVVRHSTWTGVLVMMLVLPLLVASGHPFPLRVLPPVQQNAAHVSPFTAEKVLSLLPQIDQALPESPRDASKPGRVSWAQWVEGVYIFGVAVLLLRLITGMIGARRIQRRARLVDGYLTSRSCSSPITVGWVHAVTILPEGWQNWEPAKLDAVRIHESEHARRHDSLVQWLALVNRAVFWFHPLSWWLERQLAALSEEACDIAVLERGHDAGAYSRYLLDLARSVNDSRHRVRVLGMAMPGRYLPQRIQKLLGGIPTPRVSVLRVSFAGAVFFLLSVGLSTAILVRGQSTKTTYVGAEIMVQAPGADVLLAASENSMPLQIGDKLRDLPGVQAVAPVMVKMTFQDVYVIYGIDSHFTDATDSFHWREGGLFKTPDEIVVDDFWAARNSTKPGDTVTILNHQFKVSGVVEHGHGARMYMSMEDLGKVTGSAIRAGVFYAKLQDPDQIKAVIAEIDELLPGYTVRDMVALMSLSR
jgi:hypothetical protein